MPIKHVKRLRVELDKYWKYRFIKVVFRKKREYVATQLSKNPVVSVKFVIVLREQV